MAGDAAEEKDDIEEEEEDEETVELSADAAKQAKQLDSLTDFVEDKETATKVDAKEVEERLKELRKKQDEMDKKRQEKEKQLAAVKIKKEDLELMCQELPLCEKEALERVLREHDGNLVSALSSAVKIFPSL